MKVMLKGCKRCGGDLVRARTDPETVTVTCLQCGYERDLAPVDTWTRVPQALRETAQANLKEVAA